MKKRRIPNVVRYRFNLIVGFWYKFGKHLFSSSRKKEKKKNVKPCCCHTQRARSQLFSKSVHHGRQDSVKQAIQQQMINPVQNGVLVPVIDPSRMLKEI